MGIDTQERIRQIETGTSLETTKVIEDPVKTKQYFIDLVKTKCKRRNHDTFSLIECRKKRSYYGNH